MKKLILIASSLLFATSVYGASATPTVTAAPTPDTQQKLDILKDRLASAATQLKQSQKRAIFGTVKATSVSTITVATKTSDMKIELTDTISVFQILKGKRTTLTTDQVTRGDDVVVFGDYDTNLDILKAQVIFIQGTLPERLSGTITAVSKINYTITIATPEGQSFIVDFETTTKNFNWTKEKGVQKAGFSQLVVGDTIHVLETPAPKIANRVSAIRILDIGNLTGTTPTPTATPTATPTTKTTPKTTPTP
ncbi:MAG: hypothetical protein NT149_02900 [Candidatus Gottesmanbacteria bacterium]|nr:hypothetical protein [Candidatus Gottesmanbacteria bacterium]